MPLGLSGVLETVTQKVCLADEGQGEQAVAEVELELEPVAVMFAGETLQFGSE